MGLSTTHMERDLKERTLDLSPLPAASQLDLEHHDKVKLLECFVDHRIQRSIPVHSEIFVELFVGADLSCHDSQLPCLLKIDNKTR